MINQSESPVASSAPSSANQPGQQGQSKAVSIQAAVALMSFAGLLLELSLTRIFSVVLFYHFAFLAISVALLGLGAGGVFAYIRKDWLARWELPQIGALLCAVDAVLILVVLEVVLHLRVSLAFNAANMLRVSLLYMITAVPFFFIGLLFSVVFARNTSRIGALYGADLLGGAAACLVLVPVLNTLGGPNAALCASLALSVSSLVWAPRGPLRGISYATLAIFVALIGANHAGKVLDVVYAKGRLRDPATIEFARWNAISRVEVEHQGNTRTVVIDADASTHIQHLDPKNVDDATRHGLYTQSPSIVNVLRPHGAYAIIGPGGGPDVLRAVVFGSTNVTGIEINPLIAETVMKDLYADYSLHLYTRPEVHIHVSDGRSFVRNSVDRYDVVQMSLVDTWASTAAGAFALSENNLYTVEAFKEYFQHLQPDGFLAIARWEFRRPREALRVVSQGMAALRELGVTDVEQHFIVVSEGPLTEDGRTVLVLAKKSAVTPEELRTLSAHVALNPAMSVLYTPDMPVPNAATAVDSEGYWDWHAFGALLHTPDTASFTSTYAYDITAATDNNPFFFFTFKAPQFLSILSPMQGGVRSIDWKVNLGVAVLGVVLVVSVLAIAGFLLLPLALYKGARARRTLPLLYFVAVGLGYIFVEMAFIQRFVLFLGHPTYALTVVIFLMMLASGLGSTIARRWFQEEPLRVRSVLLGIAVVLVTLVGLLPPVLQASVGLPFVVKLVMCAVLIIPIGFLMGMPFPSGLRALADAPGDNTVEWAWAMNAASSVLGSVLSIIVAIRYGLGMTLTMGAIMYLISAVLLGSRKWSRAD